MTTRTNYASITLHVPGSASIHFWLSLKLVFPPPNIVSPAFMIVAVDDSPKSIALEVLDIKYATDISGSDQSKLVFGCRCEAVNFEGS